MATHTVKKGDTLSAIAKQYGSTVDDIAKANGISNPNLIYAGQTLNIGNSDTGGTASTTPAQTPAKTELTAPTFNYTKSDAVAQAEAMLQQHLATKPGDFSYSMQTGWDDIMNQILNREKFSYDLNGDALYQQYKDQYATQGKLASMDVMGQAAAMTGGYGNSYAQSVGQQAYQGYLQQLNDKVPELYQLALNQYNQEGQDLYNQYGLHADKYSQEYGEHRDKASDYYTDLNYLTDNARYMSETEYNQALQDFNIKYGAYRDTVTDDQWQKTFDEGVRQFDAQFEESVRQFDVSQSNKQSSYTAPEGWDTEKIKAFQAANGLEVDGIWGPKTDAKYKEVGDNVPVDTKKWSDYDEKTHNKLVAENGGSYYQQVLNDLKKMKQQGKSNADVSAFLQESLGNSYISQSEYKTLYNKYRDNKL